MAASVELREYWRFMRHPHQLEVGQAVRPIVIEAGEHVGANSSGSFEQSCSTVPADVVKSPETPFGVADQHQRRIAIVDALVISRVF